MSKIAIAVHGGAGTPGKYLKQHTQDSIDGLKDALLVGYQLLKKGKSALAAVELATMKLEDNPFFNAGRGSVLNQQGHVEMDAAIMDGSNLKAGAVAVVRQVKNPIQLAEHIMKDTKHVMLAGDGALDFAKTQDLTLKPEDYFITQHQYDQHHGTVGAVAFDKKGNLAAATSTGGISNKMPSRIGDSCIIGSGCYAANSSCAVSATGSGEFIITRVVAHTIAMYMELKKYPLQKACDHVIFKRDTSKSGEVGVIAIDKTGKVYIAYNTKSMRYAYIDIKGNLRINGYIEEIQYVI